MFGQEGYLFMCMVTFKIIVRYFIRISTAKAFRICRHFPNKHWLVFPILVSSFSLSLLLISSPARDELNSLDEISGSRSYGLSLFMSGKQSLSLSLDEESSVTAILPIIFFARKLRHHILEPSLFCFKRRPR